MRKRFALVTAALLAATFAPAGFGLGFSDIEVHSALNQPLNAEIRLLAVKPAEREALTVALADPAMFERFGIQRPAILENLEIELVPGSGGDTHMRVLLSSDRPIREPFLTFLLEARWSGRRSLREYTVLLDPPVTAPAAASEPQRAPAATAEAPRNTTAGPGSETAGDWSAPAAAAPKAETPGPRAEPPDSVPAASPATEPEPGQTYGPVAPSETLWSIAYALRPDPSISMDQMLLAIYQANPHAFDDNINLMHKGAVLSIPGADEIRRIDAQVASMEVRDQKRVYARLRPASPPPADRGAPAERLAESGAAGGAETAPADGRGELRLEPPEEPEDEVLAAGGMTESEPAPSTDDAEQEPPPGETASALAATARGPQQTAGEPTGGDDAPSGEAVAGAPESAASGDGQPQEVAANESATNDAEEASQPAAVAGTDDSTGRGEDSGAGETAAADAPFALPGMGGMFDPRWILLALAGMTLVAGLVLFLRRRQYKPMAAADLGELQDLADARVEPAADVAAESGPAPDVEELIEDVDSLIENELYDEALEALDLALEHHPDDPRVQRKVIEAHYISGQRDAFVEKAAAFYPDPGEDDEGWRIVAAWGRQLAPDEERFASVPPPQSASEIAPEPIDDAETDLNRLLDEANDGAGGGSLLQSEQVGSVETDSMPTFDIDDVAKEPDPLEASSQSGEVENDSGEEEFDAALAFPEESAAIAGEEADAAAPQDDGSGLSQAAEEPAPESDDTPSMLDVDLSDFDFQEAPDPDKETDREPDTEKEESAAAPNEDALDLAEFDLDDLALDYGDAAGSADEAATAGGNEDSDSTKDTADTADTGIELGDLEFLDQPEERTAPDLGPVDEPPDTDAQIPDRPDSGEPILEPSADTPAPEEAAGDEGAESATADAGEIATKLDLAHAYLDMGEPGMASSLLEEVREHGDDDQRREAEDLLSRAG